MPVQIQGTEIAKPGVLYSLGVNHQIPCDASGVFNFEDDQADAIKDAERRGLIPPQRHEQSEVGLTPAPPHDPPPPGVEE